MKTRSSIRLLVLACCALVLPVTGKDRPEAGFLRLVFAAAGEGKFQASIDGGVLLEAGYDPGQRTGGIGLKPGKHVVEVRRPGVEPVSQSLDLVAGETVTLVVHIEELPAAGGPPRRALRLHRLAAGGGAGYGLQLLSVCRREVSVAVVVEGRKPVERVIAKRLQPLRVDLGRRKAMVRLKPEGGGPVDVRPDDPGSYAVILFEEAGGGVAAVVFFNPEFEPAG